MAVSRHKKKKRAQRDLAITVQVYLLITLETGFNRRIFFNTPETHCARWAFVYLALAKHAALFLREPHFVFHYYYYAVGNKIIIELK